MSTHVVVLGAGAMGSLFGGLVAEGGLDVTLVDPWREHIHAIRKGGLRMVGHGGDRRIPVEATTDPVSVRSADIVFVQCKANFNGEAAASVRHLFAGGGDTVAISFQNGLGNEEELAGTFGGDRVLGGLTAQGANIESPGVVRNHADLPSYIGEMQGGVSERTRSIAKILTDANLPTEASENIRRDIWRGELVPNILAGERNLSRVARVGSERECIVESYPSPVCGPIANLFVSEGRNGQVIRIDVRTRTGAQPSLAQAIRDSLRPIADGHCHIGMGGFFKVLGGRVRSHVMPDYGCIGFDYYDTDRERVVRDFLQFYEHMGPDLLCFSTLWTGDPTGGDLNLRPSGEHTHFCHVDDAAQQAGHYHGDITPGEMHYLGFFNLAERILRFGDVYEDLGTSP